jgi:hypothetical protein
MSGQNRIARIGFAYLVVALLLLLLASVSTPVNDPGKSHKGDPASNGAPTEIGRLERLELA